MHRLNNILMTDLRALINELGHDGGAIGPSIYDTAQVLRMAPPAAGIWPAIDWLISQQQPDGGWGDPAVPLARDVPTLAVLLLLQGHSQRRLIREAIQRAVAFMHRQAVYWARPLPDDLPVGVELLLPRLLDEASQLRIEISNACYGQLMALGGCRRTMIAKLKPTVGTTPMHSWEAWGIEATPDLLDAVGSVGHSPAATAAWIHAALAEGAKEETIAPARAYLERASAATGLSVPGLVPTVWPVTRFEQSFGLYALLASGLIQHPELREVIEPQLDTLQAAMRPDGISLSDYFHSDGDDSAAAVAVLHATGRSVDSSILDLYAHDDHFCAWRQELQPSISLTARVVHTYSLFDRYAEPSQAYLLRHQLSDGRWPSDKWHGSWLYPTCHAILALTPGGYKRALDLAANGLLAYQQPDGGWGGASCSNPTDTAFAIISLKRLLAHGVKRQRIEDALRRAFAYMCEHYRPFAASQHGSWLGKEVYRPQRIDRVFEVGAMLAVNLGLE